MPLYPAGHELRLPYRLSDDDLTKQVLFIKDHPNSVRPEEDWELEIEFFDRGLYHERIAPNGK
jgi:hypothetical protein